MDIDPLLTPQDAAEFLALSKSWLAKLRLTGDGPPYVKLGRRVRYRFSDLEAWLHGQVRRSTSDPGLDPNCSNGAGCSTAWPSPQAGRR